MTAISAISFRVVCEPRFIKFYAIKTSLLLMALVVQVRGSALFTSVDKLKSLSDVEHNMYPEIHLIAEAVQQRIQIMKM